MRSLFLFATLPVFFLAGCQSSQETPAIASPESAAVSSIPWNKPANWEGTSALGGFNSGGH